MKPTCGLSEQVLPKPTGPITMTLLNCAYSHWFELITLATQEKKKKLICSASLCFQQPSNRGHFPSQAIMSKFRIKGWSVLRARAKFKKLSGHRALRVEILFLSFQCSSLRSSFSSRKFHFQAVPMAFLTSPTVAA